MTVEQPTKTFETREVPKVIEALSKIPNKYFYARFLEISTLLSYLLDKGWLKKENLSGPVLDLGTGSGIGLLALRGFAPKATLEGIDNQKFWSDRNWYTGFNYPIPIPGLLETIGAHFEETDILDFLDLRSFYAQESALVTAFYANIGSWGDSRSSIVMKEIGGILPPGGQLLLTSNHDIRLPQLNWASEEFVLTGTEGKYSRTLLLPFPDELRQSYWTDIQSVASIQEILGLKYLLEDQLFETDGREIGLVRDGRVKLFTK